MFAHAARNAAQVAHLGDIERAGARLGKLELRFFLESGEDATLAERPAAAGRMAVDTFLDARHDAEADFYLCGHFALHAGQRAALLARGVTPSRIHREVFD